MWLPRGVQVSSLGNHGLTGSCQGALSAPVHSSLASSCLELLQLLQEKGFFGDPDLVLFPSPQVTPGKDGLLV